MSIFLDFLYPKKCINCNKSGKYVCNNCEIQITDSAQICPVCRRGSFSGIKHATCGTKYSPEGLTSIWDYDGIVKKAIYRIKYYKKFDIAHELVERSLFVINQDEDRFNNFLQFNESAISFVPLHKDREKKRRFNQAEKIAKHLGKLLRKPVVSTLEKVVNTRSQTRLDRKERLRNVRGAFAEINKMSRISNILLVDDVFTTGATLRECTRVLKKNGAKQVWLFTLARTP